jgi:hypothetical protein
MKKTAVEWLKDQLENLLLSTEMHPDNPDKHDHWNDVFDEALRRERQQREDDMDAALTAYVFNTNTK